MREQSRAGAKPVSHLVVASVLALASCTSRSIAGGSAAEEPAEVVLERGQRQTVSGTDLTVEAENVVDMTSQGCLGGPVGCRDRVDLVVERGKERQKLPLSMAHTEAQKSEGQNQGEAFGYRFELRKLDQGRAGIAVSRSGERRKQP